MSTRRVDLAGLAPESALASVLREGAERVGGPALVEYDGASIRAREGEPLALSLLASGRRVISRSVKFHRPRGALCLRGGCDGCLLRVDGVPNTMSCRVPVRSGLVARSQNAFPSAAIDLFRVTDWFFPKSFDHHHLMVQFGPALNRTMQGFARRMAGLGTLPDAEGPVPEPERLRCDVLVVGGGVAGLTAATELARKGLSVLLCEEEAETGGMLLEELAWLDAQGARRTGFSVARGLAEAAEAAGVTLRRSASVVASYDEGTLAVGPERALWIEPRARVFACGGHEGVGLFEGNERPGVLTARALARALRWGVLPGSSFVLTGATWPAAGLAEALRVAGAAVYHAPEGVVLEARGGRELRAVRLREGAREHSVRAEVLAVAQPAAPAYELAGQAGVQSEPREGADGFWPEADAEGATPRERVFVTGYGALGEVRWERAAEHARRCAARVATALAEA